MRRPIVLEGMMAHLMGSDRILPYFYVSDMVRDDALKMVHNAVQDAPHHTWILCLTQCCPLYPRRMNSISPFSDFTLSSVVIELYHKFRSIPNRVGLMTAKSTNAL